jgi:hypothetical protein
MKLPKGWKIKKFTEDYTPERPVVATFNGVFKRRFRTFKEAETWVTSHVIEMKNELKKIINIVIKY